MTLKETRLRLKRSADQRVLRRSDELRAGRAGLPALLSPPAAEVQAAAGRLELGARAGEEVSRTGSQTGPSAWLTCFVTRLQGSEEGYLRKTAVRSVFLDPEGSGSDSEPRASGPSGPGQQEEEEEEVKLLSFILSPSLLQWYSNEGLVIHASSRQLILTGGS